MRYPFSVALFLACLVPAFGQTPAPPQIPAVTTRMQEFVTSHDLSGAVTLVGRSSGIIHLGAVGEADIASNKAMTTDTLFRIASMTKPITAMGIMILADEGKLSPDDAVEKHLPDFKGQMLKVGQELKAPARPITLRDLLTHTSGLPNYPPVAADVYTKRNKTLAQTTALIAKQPLTFEPGTKWSYCNPGIDTLGRIIEVVSGEPYHTFLQKRVFDPLEMKSTTFYPTTDQVGHSATVYAKKDGQLVPASNLILDFAKDAKHPVPAGGLYSCAGDLATFSQAMLGRGAKGTVRIVSEKNFAEMTKTQTGDIKTGFVDGMSFGYGFAVVKESKGVTAMLSAGTFGHGGAFGTQYWIDPKQDLFVILLIARSDLGNGDASPIRQEFQRLAVEALPRK
ncbi:serine hydrolase domain-containing protein [Limnoglobus roseus]|uniref:Serine hydrolase n=1 Tax=Limnoglobus roseus TaxID=2598579 RepID=A0A5C1AGX8_9BACT|nr:serine hydrolase domain-containing protein [Limnoglobus roseus]QEL18679.1 serine hydrolase [Limnoglobus roseus]